MVRVTGIDRRTWRNKVFALAKGFRGRAKNCYSIAIRRVQKALQHAYRSRKLKKRDFRSLWITRINSAARQNETKYSDMMSGLVKAGVQLNRKVLSQLAIHEPASFTAIAQISKERNAEGLRGLLK